MRWVADENVDREVVESLRALGHVVSYACEEARGTTDDDLLARAHSSGAVLITNDKDFGELVYRQRRAMAGVVLLRLPGVSAARKAGIVQELVSERGDELQRAFTVVTETRIRIRGEKG